MFKNEKIGIKDENGKELREGDVVETIYPCPFEDHLVRGIIFYSQEDTSFYLDFPHKGISIPLSRLVDFGFLYIGRDDNNLGCDNPLLNE